MRKVHPQQQLGLAHAVHLRSADGHHDVIKVGKTTLMASSTAGQARAALERYQCFHHKSTEATLTVQGLVDMWCVLPHDVSTQAEMLFHSWCEVARYKDTNWMRSHGATVMDVPRYGCGGCFFLECNAHPKPWTLQLRPMRFTIPGTEKAVLSLLRAHLMKQWKCTPVERREGTTVSQEFFGSSPTMSILQCYDGVALRCPAAVYHTQHHARDDWRVRVWNKLSRDFGADVRHFCMFFPSSNGKLWCSPVAPEGRKKPRSPQGLCLSRRERDRPRQWQRQCLLPKGRKERHGPRRRQRQSLLPKAEASLVLPFCGVHQTHSQVLLQALLPRT